MRGLLLLEDGTLLRGRSVGATGIVYGEVVFTTAMTGYQEVVTDPSYAGQLVCFSAPMIGNYGVDEERCESSRVHAGAVLMREARGPEWTDWLAARGVPALTDIDTRSLVLHLRERGSLRAAVVGGDAAVDEVLATVRAVPAMAGRALAPEVSTRERYVYAGGDGVRVAVVDYGCKRSILRRLSDAGAAVTVYPHDAPADVLAEHDAVLLSNGPGDPAPLRAEVETVRRLLGRVPLLGICLGHQLLALAAGHKTFKLPFGHRGANHPVLERETGRVLVTSQNHGFAVAPSSAAAVSHRSLYDETVEGIRLPAACASSVQFHPEAAPGPHDARSLLDGWVEEVRSYAQAA